MPIPPEKLPRDEANAAAMDRMDRSEKFDFAMLFLAVQAAFFVRVPIYESKRMPRRENQVSAWVTPPTSGHKRFDNTIRQIWWGLFA
jgi:hypothetical protein